MPHIHTSPGHHDLTVTAFVIKLSNNYPKILLHMHRKHNRLMPVGGHVELNETPWQALAHELREESGYTLSDMQVLQPADSLNELSGATLHPYPMAVNTHVVSPGHFHTDLSYAFVTPQFPLHSVAETESDDLRWLNRQELDQLSEPIIYINTKDLYAYALDTCLVKWRRVDTSIFKF